MRPLAGKGLTRAIAKPIAPVSAMAAKSLGVFTGIAVRELPLRPSGQESDFFHRKTAARTESQAAPSLVLAVAVSGMALTPVVDACTCCAAGTAVPMT